MTADHAMTAERIAELQSTCARATDGPWIGKVERIQFLESDDVDLPGYVYAADGKTVVAHVPERYGPGLTAKYEDDLEFLAAARTALPDALAAIASLQAALAVAEQAARFALRREETSRKFWLRAAESAIAGDMRELRLRVDLAKEPPVEGVLSDAALKGTHPAQGGWLPIESAPKDGSQFLIWTRRLGFAVVTHDVDDPMPKDIVPSGHNLQVDDGKNGPYPIRGDYPTRWMPLPSAPTQGGENVG